MLIGATAPKAGRDGLGLPSPSSLFCSRGCSRSAIASWISLALASSSDSRCHVMCARTTSFQVIAVMSKARRAAATHAGEICSRST